MNFNLLGKPVILIKNLLMRNSRKKEENIILLGGDTSIPQKLKYKKPNFTFVEKVLREKGRGFFGVIPPDLSINNLVKKGDNKRARMLCARIALKAVLHQLPKTFAGNEGVDFAILIGDATLDKQKYLLNNPNSNINAFRVTGFEVCDFIKKNKNTPGHIAQTFRGYTDKEIKQLSEDWFDLKVTPSSIAKCLSNCASFNSAQHMAYFNLIGFNLNNVHIWLPRVFEDRIRCEIHSYQLTNNYALRITYEIPIPLRRSGPYKKKYQILASDPNNFFKIGMVSIKIVIEFTFDTTTKKYNKKSGTLITAFLHHMPYKTDDIQTMLNGYSSKYYFGGHKRVTKNYINRTGTIGMPSLPEPGPLLFRLLNKSVTQAAKQVEAKHKSGFIATQVKQFTKRWKAQLKNKIDILVIEKDPGNKKEIRTVYGPYANSVNHSYSKRLAIQRNNGLI